jgi:hypothetical protein
VRGKRMKNKIIDIIGIEVENFYSAEKIRQNKNTDN